MIELQRLRLGRGWSRAEFARRARLSERTIFRAEAGCAVAPLTIARLARALDVEASIVERALMKEKRTGEVQP